MLSSAAALLDGLFEHPTERFPGVPDVQISEVTDLPQSIFRSLLGLRDPELKFRSPLQLQTLSSAPGEFQDIERILVWPILGAAVVRSRADRDALFHMDDLLFLIHPDEIERDLCVLHPEHPSLRLRERKEHAAVGA